MATFRPEISHRPTRNKKYKIYIMVRVAGMRKRVDAGIELERIKDFNSKTKQNGWVRASVDNAEQLNHKLEWKISELKEAYTKLENKGKVTANAVVHETTKETISPSFLNFVKQRQNDLEQAGGYRNSKKYGDFYNKLKAFATKKRMKDVTIEDITPAFITDFQNFLHQLPNARHPEKRLHPNTIQVQFAVFKAIVEELVTQKLILPDDNPFRYFKKGTFKGIATHKDKISLNDLKKILELDLEEGSLISVVRDVFIFAMLCAGIRIGDLLQLRWRAVSDGRLKYVMNKNSKEQNLVLISVAEEILNKYRLSNLKPDDYIFPFLDNRAVYAQYVTSEERITMPPDIRRKLQNAVESKTALINKYLKKIAVKAQITCNITTHIARHTFANMAMNAHVDYRIIQDLLQHSKLSTTETYMGYFKTEDTDVAMETIAKIFGGSNGCSKKEEFIKYFKELSIEDQRSLLQDLKV